MGGTTAAICNQIVYRWPAATARCRRRPGRAADPGRPRRSRLQRSRWRWGRTTTLRRRCRPCWAPLCPAGRPPGPRFRRIPWRRMPGSSAIGTKRDRRLRRFPAPGSGLRWNRVGQPIGARAGSGWDLPLVPATVAQDGHILFSPFWGDVLRVDL